MERTTIGEFTSGVWGGVYFPEHRDPVRRDICGSHAGALAHKRAHERNCIECRDVENMRENLRKSARRQCRIAGCDNLCRPHRWYCSPECQHVATVGTAAGYHLHQRRHEEACEPCRRAMNHPGSRVKAFAPLANAA